MRAKCPNNPQHKSFITTAHVVQEWLVDENGEFLAERATIETTHKPDPDNGWSCSECFAEAVFVPDDQDDDIIVVDLVKENVKIGWARLGEGVSGDYNPEDPEDEELLRFDVYRLEGTEWVPVNDASYCTNFPALATPAEQIKALEYLMEQLYDAVSSGQSVKRLCEQLSHIGIEVAQEAGSDQGGKC